MSSGLSSSGRTDSAADNWEDFVCDHAGDKLSLDFFWLRDESLQDSADLEDPDVITAEIVEDLQAALEQFSAIEADGDG